jgi:hypothetical protein
MIGQSICGEVRFEITGDTTNLYQCRCSQCRKQGGSSSNTAMIVHENPLSWKQGKELVTQYKDKK